MSVPAIPVQTTEFATTESMGLTAAVRLDLMEPDARLVISNCMFSAREILNLMLSCLMVLDYFSP